ncbi:MAG: hypothetical protein F6K47_35365 [Symploca sp. SIO2E6]|nr:hypothetical protein [Symploca sp. SIO2E6]
MTRVYSNLVNENIKALLNTIADKSSTPALYREAMTKIGMNFGDALLAEIDHDHSSVYIACTVEDADFLARGILNRLENRLQTVAFACFSNQRFSPFEVEDLKVAPIIKKYQEPTASQINYLIIVKSIISGACVVRTNLVDIIQKIEPERIYIVAPVMYYNAQEKLKSEFEANIYDKLQFFYFAQDDERTAQGEVIPGIGGMVYDRLGFQGQEGKNSYIPEIVKSRRSQLIKHQ